MWNPFRRRTRIEERAIDSVPWEAGGSISPRPTQDRALTLTPVYAANRHLADQISTLPLKAYRRAGETREPMPSLPQLFQFLEQDGTLVDWLCRAVLSLSLQGNAIGVITGVDGFGFPTGVWWRPRSEFYVDDDTVPGRPQWFWNGRRIDRSEIVHIPWLTVAGRTLGLSPIEAFALSVDAGLKAQTYGSDWFDAGGVPPGTFKNTEKTVKQDEAEVIKNRLVQAIRTRKPIVYGSDWDFNPITIPPEQAQFVETQKLTANQIAAIYGIEPEEVGGEAANSLTYNNEEHRQTKRMANLRPWLSRLEAGFSALLPERQYVRFNPAAVIRGDLMTRYRAYQIARQIGLLNVDEIRAIEDLPPLPNGQGQDYTPLAHSDQPGELVEDQAAQAQAQRSERALNGNGHVPELTWTDPLAMGRR